MLLKSIDIHNHLLPGVDDGFGSAEESLEAIRLLSAAGVGELVFTPHINPDVYPERYPYMAECLEDFDRLHENGCRFQLNYISFAGVYGRDSVKIIRYLARRGYCDFVATDLHSIHQLERILSSNPAFLLRKPFTKFLNPNQPKVEKICLFRL